MIKMYTFRYRKPKLYSADIIFLYQFLSVLIQRVGRSIVNIYQAVLVYLYTHRVSVICTRRKLRAHDVNSRAVFTE